MHQAFSPAKIAKPDVTPLKTLDSTTFSDPKMRANISTKHGICADPPVRTTASISSTPRPERSTVSSKHASI
jgi:hypothetical protein